MKERILDVIKWGLIVIIAVMAFYITNRNYIISAGVRGGAYKMDKMTGQVWLVTPNTVKIIEPKTSIKRNANKLLNRRGETNIPEGFVLEDETKE